MTSTTDSQDAVIRTDRRGRLLVSPEQRETLLDEFERSGLSGMAFCKLHGLVYPTFATWRKKRRDRLKPGSPAFAEVVVSEEETFDPAETTGAALKVTLPSGMTIEVSSRTQLPLLIELLRSLS